MNCNYYKIILFLILSFLFSYTFSQDKTLVGKVTTFDNIPIFGVDIQVKSSGKIVQTDTPGGFQFFCDETDKLKYEANCFFPKKVKVEKEIRMILENLNLINGQDNHEQAERYVNVGYGYVSSKDLLYSISLANQNDIDFSKYDSVLDAIQGQFPGGTIENGSVIFRRTTTLSGSPGDAATVVIDGAIVSSRDLADMSLHDIQSKDILKDGSSSVYGSCSGNGAIIIQTKKGK